MVTKIKAKTKLKLERVAPHEWSFRYSRLDAEVYDRFHAALEQMDEREYEKAIPSLRLLVKEFPEFIDARHHLAIAIKATNRELDYLASYEWRTAAETGLAAFPAGFVMGRDRLEWGWLDNRPFLRAYHGLAMTHLDRGETGEALAICQDLLDLNPGDNQGVRSLAVDLLFARRRPAEVPAVCDRYPDDGMPALPFGRALALFMLDRRDEAAAALREAARQSPLVAKELMKKTHHQPRQHYPGFLTVGGADEAYYYWRESGEHWKRAPGALAWVRATLDGKGADA